MSDFVNLVENPVEPFLRTDRMPHIWCPGCGIGTTVNCFARALIESKIDLQSLALVSGIGCTGRVAGYGRSVDAAPDHGNVIGGRVCLPRHLFILEHRAEKWEPVFRWQ